MTGVATASAPAAAGAASAQRIGLVGAFGVGNLGNDETARVMLALVRSQDPTALVTAISRTTTETERSVGIPAISIFAPGAGTGGGVLVRALRKLRDFRYLLRVVPEFDTIIVPGSGLLQSDGGRLPTGDLSWVLALSLACRVRRVRLAWFAVGGSRRLRWLPTICARIAAQQAAYLSFRDEPTASSLGARVRARAKVVPDLVFSRPLEDDAAFPPEPTVSVAVMDYNPAAEGGRGTYVRRMAQVVEGLLDAGCSVRLVLGDVADHAPADEVAELVATRRHDGLRPEVEPAGTLGELIGRVRGCDVVVSTRFHVLIAAAIAGRPMVAISHADKDDALLEQLGLQHYLLDADDFRPERVIELVADARRDRDVISAQLVARVRELHDRVHREFRASGLVAPANRGSA